jgi:AcrR family transcriptional regulator
MRLAEYCSECNYFAMKDLGAPTDIAGTEGLRQRKKRATRDQLVTVALRLCAQRGFTATTVETIAEGAGVSTRTFFHYFPTKQDVFLGHERDLLARLVADVEHADAAKPPAAVLWQAIETLAQQFDDEGEHLRPLYALVVAEPSLHRRSLELQVEWEHELAATLVRRLSGANRNDRAYVLAATALACLRTSARRWATQPSRRTLLQMIRAARQSLFDDLDRIPV